MTFVGSMSVVTAYVALAFVGAIVLGVTSNPPGFASFLFLFRDRCSLNFRIALVVHAARSTTDTTSYS